MFRCSRFLQLMALGLMSGVCVRAQTSTAPNLGSQLAVDGSTTPATYTFSWWGKAGCHYLVQHSSDLMAWSFLPSFNPSGTDAVLSIQFTTDANKYFFRAIQFDPRTTLGSAGSDELPKAWELYYFGALGNAATANPSGDGMSNGYKFKMGLNPLINEAAGDADGDGILNNQDARPNDNKAGRLSVVITVPVDGGANL